MVNLSVEFAGVEFKNPILVAPGTLTDNVRSVVKAVKSGAGGVVAKSAVTDSLSIMRKWPRPRFKLLHWGRRKVGRVPESFTLYSIEQAYRGDIMRYARELREMKKAVDVPVVGSFMAFGVDECVKSARIIEESNVDMVEINNACPHKVADTGSSDEEIVKAVSQSVSIPVTVKLSPQSTDLTRQAKALERAGASGITMMSRFTGLEIDIEQEKPILHGSYAGFGGPWLRFLGLAWVSKIAPVISIPISASGGVMGWEDAVKYIMVGATTVQVCTSTLMKGYEVIGQFVKGMEGFMEEKGYDNVGSLKGRTLRNILPLDEFEREPPVYAAVDESKCLGPTCSECAKHCFYDAIEVESVAKIDLGRCDGCGLCSEFCPTFAISMERSG
ncbi:MAG: 4Fe-4S binding protein [Candidatus Geothermarchaeales archaeon]